MARTKSLNIVVTYGNTGYVVDDLGQNKSPRFELYHVPTKTIVKKSGYPPDFDSFMKKIWNR